MNKLEIILVENIDNINKEVFLNPQKNYMFITYNISIYNQMESYMSLNDNISIKLIENIKNYKKEELINYFLNLNLDTKKLVKVSGIDKGLQKTEIEKYDEWLKEKGAEIYKLKMEIKEKDGWIKSKDYWLKEKDKEILMYKNSKPIKIRNFLRRFF